MIVLNHPQGSQDWLQARAGVITASRFKDALDKVGGLDEKQQAYVDAIKSGKPESEAMRLAGYKAKPTSSTVARAIAGEPIFTPSAKAMGYAWVIAMEIIARKPLDETFVTWKMRQGQDREPFARRLYEARTGALVEEASLVLTDDSAFGYSTDGLVGDDGMIEIKSPATPEVVGRIWECPAEAHLEYIDQINGGLWITGRKWCDLVVYFPELAPVGKDLFIKRIYRDETAIEALESGLIAFHKIVRAKLALLRGNQPTEEGKTPPWEYAHQEEQITTPKPFVPVAATELPELFTS